MLDEPSFHLPVDAFHAGMTAAGNNVVVAHVLSEEWRLLDCLELFVAEDVVLVGVRCSPEELHRREQARGDRPEGLAARQFERVHAHGVYDIECDTTATSPLDCALRISAFLPRCPAPTAFEQLRAKLRPDLTAPGPEAVRLY